jgi:hypothetical protein
MMIALDWILRRKDLRRGELHDGLLPQRFGMNGVAEVNAFAPTVWDNSIM